MMRVRMLAGSLFRAVATGLVVLPLTAHFSPLTAQSITIYNDGRVLVRRRTLRSTSCRPPCSTG